ncbi:MAG: hypothetical protein ACHRXM_24595 [Isosphaerales bacterium]
MNEAPPNNRLILTTETRSGLGERVFILLFFGGWAAAGPLCMYVVPADRAMDGTEVLVIALLEMGLLGLGLFGIFAPPRGTWVLDDDAVTYCPCHRRSRALRWSSVDRLQWGYGGACLQAGYVKIPIPWERFAKTKRLPARAFAEARLSSSFDLKDVPLPESLLFRPGMSRLARLAYLAKLVALGVGITVPWATLALIAHWLPMESWVWYSPLFAGFTVVYLGGLIGGLVVYGVIRAHGELGLKRQVHPEWPWRLRRTKARELTKVAAANDPWLCEM